MVPVSKCSAVTAKHRCMGDIKCPKYIQVHARLASGGLSSYIVSNIVSVIVIDGVDSPKANPIIMGREISTMGGHMERV